jgi:hypothetical protein
VRSVRWRKGVCTGNVEEMGASPKIPALTSARWMVMGGLGTMQNALAVPVSACRLRLTGCSLVVGDSCVLMLYPPWLPQTDGGPNGKLSRVAPAQRVRRQARGRVEHTKVRPWLLRAGTYLRGFR